MKIKLYLLLIILSICSILKAQTSKTIHVTAGTLSSLITDQDLSTVRSLTLTGTIDARDFRFMRDKLEYVTQLDLSQVSIVAYQGNEGTRSDDYFEYLADRIPDLAFKPWEIGIKLNLSSVVFPTSLKSIGICAFEGCSKLESITIPSSIRKIEGASFKDCIALKSLTIPSTVDTIDNQAFAGCKGLTSLKLPPTLSYIGSQAFANCIGLTSVTIPPSLTALGSAFAYCTGLTQITIPESVTVLEYGAFEGCSGLTSIVIPQAVTQIQGYAFSKCTGITSVIIPSGVNSIGEYIFSDCTNLTTVSILSPSISTNNWIFANSPKITSLKVSWTTPPTLYWNMFYMINRSNCSLQVPYGISNLYKADYEWNQFKNITESSSGLYINATSASVMADEGSTASVEITANVAWAATSDQTWLSVSPTSGTSNSKLTFTVQANTSFGRRTAKVTVSAPGLASQTIVVTQNSADAIVSEVTPGKLTTFFTTDQLNSLTHLSLKGVIDARDFRFMRDNMPMLAALDLSEVTIAAYDGFDGTNEDYMTQYLANTIPQHAFYSRTGSGKYTLNSVILPSSLTGFGMYSFGQCSSLKSIEIPPLVNSIGVGAFMGCSSLKSLTIPSTVTKVEESAFTGCSGLTSVDLPSTITAIGASAFNGCSSLTSINIPSSMTIIETSTFSYCTGLTSINIPSTITSIADYAFYKCSGLTSVNLPNSITSLGGAFIQCTGLKNISIPESILSLGYDAFKGCTALASVTIPASVNTIGGYAFSYCDNLSSVIIHSKNVSIEGGAFSNCINLSTVTINSLYASLGDYVFNSCPKLSSITLACAIPPKCGYYNFYMVDRNLCSLDVPYGTIPRYAQASPWKEFLKIKETAGFFLATNTAIVESMEGSTATVDINSNVDWTVTFDQEWLTVSPISGTGVGQKLIFTALANQLSEPRKSVVTVSAPGIVSQEVTITQRPAPKQINLTAGSLASALTAEELNTITDLTITGIIDARDFKTMREKMPLLSNLDLRCVKIIEYNGVEGTRNWEGTFYPANDIPPYAFNKIPDGNNSLTSVICPESITGIGEYAFSMCKGLTKITIPALVSSIKENAFSYCTALNSITIENPVPPILNYSYNVFYQVNKSTCILNVPYGTTNNYLNAYQWRDFYNIAGAVNGFHLSRNNINLSGTAGSSMTLSISANVEWTATSSQDWLTVDPASGNDSVTITFTASENPSFLNDRSAYVTISSPMVKSQSIIVTQTSKPQPPKVLEVNAGGLASALTEEELATITDLTLTGTIDARDFKTIRDRMPMLAKLNISGTNIVAYTGTEGTKDLEQTTYPGNTMPEYALAKPEYNYRGNPTLINIVLPQSLTGIGQYSFYLCYALTDVIIPASVLNIDIFAFYGCTAMLNINIPSSVKSIGTMALGGLSALINVDLENQDYMSSNNVLYNKEQTKIIQCSKNRSGNFEIPTTVTSIGDYAFYYSSLLTTVKIPSSVTSIGKYAFYYCYGLTTLTIPPSVVSIGESAFNTCYGLKTLFALSKTPVNLDAAPNVFSLVRGCTLYVPIGSKNAYQTANQWKNFLTIIEINPDLIANAGIDKVTDEGQIVMLQGAASVNTSGKRLTYKWTAPEGITLSSDTIANPTFTAPQVKYDTNFTLSLVISDGVNHSTPDQVVVTVRNVIKPPIANAGADQEVSENSMVTLDGTASYDFDDRYLSYQWTAPAGITLSSIFSNKPYFKAPEVTADTDLIIYLQVYNGAYSTKDSVVITVKQVNLAPVANAGVNQITSEGSKVTLDGTLSTDKEGNALTYLWTAPEGIMLSSATSATPSFIAPELSADTSYTFNLVVNDGNLNSAPSEVTILVRNIPPLLGLITHVTGLSNPVLVYYQLFMKEQNSFIKKTITYSMTEDSLFVPVEPGEWIVLAVPLFDPSTFIPTYSGDVFNWDEAEIINVPDKSTVVKVINGILPLPAITGVGRISGSIHEKALDGTKSVSISGEENIQFAPHVKDALIRLYKKDDLLPIASWITDDTGFYIFDKLAITDYEIQVEIPGFAQSERFLVSLSQTMPATKIWFAVNTSTKVITDNKAIESYMLKVYPNPTKGIVHISGLSGKTNMEVYSMDGKLILRKETTLTEVNIDISSQVSGTYVFVINDQRFKVFKK